MRRVFIIIGFVFISVQVFGQELPPLSNYQHSWMIFNPAFTGTRDALSANFFIRQTSWANAGPMYQQLSMHTPTKNEKVALGGYFFRKEDPGNLDFSTIFGKGAPVRTNFFYTNYSYRTSLGRIRMSMGLSAGLTSFKTSYEGTNLPDKTDEVFAGNEAKYLPNFGAGVLFYTTGDGQSFFAGLSVPYFMSLSTSNKIQTDFSKYNYILTGGFKKKISDQFTLNPSALLMYKREEEKLKYAASMNIGLIEEMLWVGAIYKSAFNVPKPMKIDVDGNEVAVQAEEIQIAKVLSFNFNINIPKSNLLLGYSVDYHLNSVSSYFNFSHELIVRWEFRTTVPANIPFYY